MATYFIEKTAISKDDVIEKTKEYSPYAAAAAGTGVAGYNAHKLKQLGKNPDTVAITYGYKKGTGGGHLYQAKAYSELLNSRGYKTELLNTDPAGTARSITNRYGYSAHMDTGWGNSWSLQKGSRKVDHMPPDYDPAKHTAKDLIPQKKSTTVRKDAKVEKMLSELSGKTPETFAGKKIITIPTGESGYQVVQRYKATQEALKHRGDYHIVAFTGNIPKETQATLDALGATNKDLTTIGLTPQKKYKNIIGNSAANIGYGGSSTVTEQFSFKNPNINIKYRDRKWMADNLEYAKKNYGIDYFDIENPESTQKFKTTLNDILDQPDKYRKISASRARKYSKNKKAFNDQIIKNVDKAIADTKVYRESLKGGARKGLIAGTAVAGAGIGAAIYNKYKDLKK